MLKHFCGLHSPCLVQNLLQSETTKHTQINKFSLLLFGIKYWLLFDVRIILSYFTVHS